MRLPAELKKYKQNLSVAVIDGLSEIVGASNDHLLVDHHRFIGSDEMFATTAELLKFAHNWGEAIKYSKLDQRSRSHSKGTP